MSTSTYSVESGAEWFSMIIAYLKMKSLVLWFSLHPESPVQPALEQFECVWPALLDEMMRRATAATIEELKKVCDTSLN